MKTLKDFHCNCPKDSDYCPIIEIEAELKKWIEELERCEKLDESPVDIDGLRLGNEVEWNECPSIVAFIKHFIGEIDGKD